MQKGAAVKYLSANLMQMDMIFQYISFFGDYLIKS